MNPVAHLYVTVATSFVVVVTVVDSDGLLAGMRRPDNGPAGLRRVWRTSRKRRFK